MIPVYTLAVSVSCQDVGDRQWHDVSRIAAQEMLVRVNDYEAFDAHAALYTAAGSPFAPRIVQLTVRNRMDLGRSGSAGS